MTMPRRTPNGTFPGGRMGPVLTAVTASPSSRPSNATLHASSLTAPLPSWSRARKSLGRSLGGKPKTSMAAASVGTRRALKSRGWIFASLFVSSSAKALAGSQPSSSMRPCASFKAASRCSRSYSRSVLNRCCTGISCQGQGCGRRRNEYEAKKNSRRFSLDVGGTPCHVGRRRSRQRLSSSSALYCSSDCRNSKSSEATLSCHLNGASLQPFDTSTVRRLNGSRVSNRKATLECGLSWGRSASSRSARRCNATRTASASANVSRT
mmetsp:Transcript_14535/g.40015  ORF Transcript_14535/g.40015 Transcript_14535/m.40015 type:complete len:266 (-) Transcript_14535:766-1563(-)